MKIKRIGVLYHDNPLSPFTDEHMTMLRESAPDAEIIYSTSIDGLISQTDDVDVLLTMPQLDPDKVEKWVNFCQNAPSLKLIHCLISGIDSIVNTDIVKLPVRITSTKGIQSFPMIDTALAFIYSHLRCFPALMRSQVKHEWNVTAKLSCNESLDKTVGIVGIGLIGNEMAKKLKLLGFRVLGAKRTRIQSEHLDYCYIMEELSEMLPQCDFLIMVCPLTAETHHLISFEQLKLMKNTAFLINLSRGAVIDDEAVIWALKEKQIGGAGLDIFVKEPLAPDNPYWDFENVIISHHISPMTPYITDRTMQVSAINIKNFANDMPLMYEAER